jgi:hypothetical protein
VKKVLVLLALIAGCATAPKTVDQSVYLYENLLDGVTTSYAQCIADPACPMTSTLQAKIQTDLQKAKDLAAAAHTATMSGDMSTAQGELAAAQTILTTLKGLIPVPPVKKSESTEGVLT